MPKYKHLLLTCVLLAISLLLADKASAKPSGQRSLRMVGDSLAVGTKEYLPKRLGGWKVSTNAAVGRPLVTGMNIISAARPFPRVLAVSLFTNDDPTHVEKLVQAVKQTLSWQGKNGCVIWATISRPAVNGKSYNKANTRLRQLGNKHFGRLIVVDWEYATKQNPKLLGPDKVHSTQDGYKLRAQMFADAARMCDR